MYLLHQEMDRMEANICQHFYWSDIRYATWKEVTNCDNCQRTKGSNKKYGKLPAKLDEGIPQNKICVVSIEPYTIMRKGKIFLKKPLQ